MKKSPDCAKLMCWNLLKIILNGSTHMSLSRKKYKSTLHYRTHQHRNGSRSWSAHMAQDPHTKKWNTGTIHEELEEPHSYTIQDSAGQYYRWNWNWIKPRQVDETDLSMATELMGQVAGSDSAHSHSSPEASASGPATHTPVDAMPTVESTVLQNPISARETPVSHTPTPRQRISRRVNKSIAPR